MALEKLLHPAGAAGPDPRAILNSIGEVVYDWDIGSDAIRWGANVCDVLGFSDAALIASGKLLAERLAPESPASRYEAVMSASAGDDRGGGPYQAQYGLLLPDPARPGEAPLRLWVEDTGRAFLGPDGRPVRAHGIVRVITARFEAERQLAFRAIFDPLTGALNRAQLCEHIERLCAQSRDKPRAFCILLVEIRGLARINREYGYDAADELISGLIARLRGNLRSADVVGRYSGNKFALVMDNCDADQMNEAARRLIALMDKDPVATSASAIPVVIEIGGVLAPRYGRQAQVLLQHAEEAMEAARAREGQRFVAFEPSLARDFAKQRLRRMGDDLLAALNDRRIVLAFQPIVSAATGEVQWEEALMRLRNADGSLASPCDVLPLAEKAELIRLVDYRVLELAIARLKDEPSARLAINISTSTLLDPEWPDRLRTALALAPGAAPRLIVEITESAAVTHLDGARHALLAMRELHVKTAMDDFGAGHASFRHLRHLAVDMLKIDGAFMQNLARSPDDRLFVRTLVDLARNLAIPVVAEWVEDAETARLLNEWGVDYLQGNYFGKAEVMPVKPAPGSALAG